MLAAALCERARNCVLTSDLGVEPIGVFANSRVDAEHPISPAPDPIAYNPDQDERVASPPA